jgi:hypothetical protein
MMKNSILRIAKMNQKLLHTLSLSGVLLLSACAGNFVGWGGISDEEVVVTQEECLGETPNARAVVPYSEKDGRFVNYRNSASDYREYGERTPQDQYILSAGVGSNMSASIPPTIEEEVTDYEIAVNGAFEEAISEKTEIEEDTASGDDAVEDWLAEEGNTLRGLLSDWCERTGWRLIWNSNRNYTLSAGAMFRGRFADVSSALIRTVVSSHLHLSF